MSTASTTSLSRATCCAAVLAATVCTAGLAAEAPVCSASSGAQAPVVVELYTSEGCSSCPPADRWLSTLKGNSNVLPLAFHVTYWDKLGWPDRFASREGTERQYALSRSAGRDGVYTPQVIAAGADFRQWPRLPLPAPAAVAGAAAPAITLARDGDTVTAQVLGAGVTAGARFAGYWAVVEDGHMSKVAAGENAGETLRHDHVVRQYVAVAAWDARAPQRHALKVSRGAPEFPRRVAFVVTDPATQRPLQAVSLGC